MQYTINDTILQIPSVQSDEMNQSETTFLQSCQLLNEFLSIDNDINDSNKIKTKKEILSIFKDANNDQFEDMTTSLTFLDDYIKTFQEISKSLLSDLEWKLSNVSSNLLSLKKHQLNSEEIKELQKEIKTEISIQTDMLTSQQIHYLQQWTSLRCMKVIFDSNIHNWSQYNSELNDKIIGKKQLCFVCQSEDNQIFGYYINVEIKSILREQMAVDDKTFIFNLVSNGRLNNPMKFEIRDTLKGGYKLFGNQKGTPANMISIGDIRLAKSDWKEQSFCYQYDDAFDYKGIEKATCGVIHPNRFTLKRMIVIQMQ